MKVVVVTAWKFKKGEVMKKSELTSGDEVVARGGFTATIELGQNRNCYTNNLRGIDGGNLDLNIYGDNMKYRGNSKYDIMEVWRYPTSYGLERKKIYTRIEKTETDLKIEALEKTISEASSQIQELKQSI
jgi:hypothetical protein